MGKKLITDAGKTELLRLAFQSEEAGGAFKFIALGGENSKGAQGETFVEVSGDNYSRVVTSTDSVENKQITISGIFQEENYAPATGGVIKEIGLCNADTATNSPIFFLYSEVPEITKTGDISLEYTIIISID